MKRILFLALIFAPLFTFGATFTTPSGAVVDELGNLITPPPFVWHPQEMFYFRVISEPIIPTPKPKPVLQPIRNLGCPVNKFFNHYINICVPINAFDA